MISRFDGVSLWSSNLENLVPFYRDVLGFDVALESPRFVIFGGRGEGLCIGSHSEVHGSARDPHRWLIRVETEDIHADVARLRARGAPIVQEPENEGEGLWLATCADPEGNLIQLNQFEHGRIFARPELVHG